MAFRFKRGSTIVLALDAVRGDPSAVSELTAQLRKLRPGGIVDHDGPPEAEFVVTERAASSSAPAGWNLTIDAETSEGLAIGTYRTDAALSVAGGRDFTQTLEIEIREPVTTS